MPELANEDVGGAVLLANDEFFAAKDNLVKPSAPVWKEGKYTDRGKWMDGWETRRRREPGHDWCIVRLGLPGVVDNVDIETTHFKGNQPERCSIDGCYAPDFPEPAELAGDDEAWTEVLDESPLLGDAHNEFGIDHDGCFTHLRLHIYPDGGVARLRVRGRALPDLDRLERYGEYDLAGVQNGGRVVECNDEHFGQASNLLLPGRADDMGQGWETRRRRDGGHDWVVVELGGEGTVRRIEVDTEHFKGNYPGACSIQGGRVASEKLRGGVAGVDWKPILQKTPLRGHTRHSFEDELESTGPYTHVRLNIFPDGGLARFRVYGEFNDPGWTRLRLRELNSLPPANARERFESCCGATRWAREMTDRRPFGNPEQLMRAAEEVWNALPAGDWLEAFAAHPRIGEDADEGDQTDAGEEWSEEEQAGTDEASNEVEEKLRELNERYYERFGFIFIVYASGKSAEQMVDILERRLRNDRETEIENAAEEQLKITKDRLRKLLR